jgi:monovalent cation:H+ antiporter-2, CPA2 family
VDHVAALLVELGLLFSGLSLLGLLAHRLGLSSVPFVLVAALALGKGGVVPLATSEPFIEAAAEIGVVLLLLALGLEFSAEELFASLRHHGSSGLVDLLLNAPRGFVAGLLLGLSWQGAVALAGVTWISSSSGTIARLLGDLGDRVPPGLWVGFGPARVGPAHGVGLAGLVEDAAERVGEDDLD